MTEKIKGFAKMYLNDTADLFFTWLEDDIINYENVDLNRLTELMIDACDTVNRENGFTDADETGLITSDIEFRYNDLHFIHVTFKFSIDYEIFLKHISFNYNNKFCISQYELDKVLITDCFD